MGWFHISTVFSLSGPQIQALYIWTLQRVRFSEKCNIIQITFLPLKSIFNFQTGLFSLI